MMLSNRLKIDGLPFGQVMATDSMQFHWVYVEIQKFIWTVKARKSTICMWILCADIKANGKMRVL